MTAVKPIPSLITLQAISFLHPGSGQSTGVVDLPIQREVHTEFPMYASSGLKGSLRDKAEQLWGKDDPKVTLTFGTSSAEQSDKPAAGALAITDARILAFPVRSLQQVFVWITCPMVIKRLLRDARLVGHKLSKLDCPVPVKDKAIVANNERFDSPLVLEELAFELQKGPATDEKAMHEVAKFIKSLTLDDSGFDSKRLIMVTDDDFKYLVKHATQVSARIKLNDQKTTTGGDGNLWYEETLPPETLLYAFTLCHKPRSEDAHITQAEDILNCLQELTKDGYLQIGGNETVGQGWCSLNLTESQS